MDDLGTWERPPKEPDELPVYSGPASSQAHKHKVKFCVGCKRFTRQCTRPSVVVCLSSRRHIACLLTVVLQDFETKAPLFQLDFEAAERMFVPRTLRDAAGRNEVLTMEPTAQGSFNAMAHGVNMAHLDLTRGEVGFSSGEVWRIERTEAGWRVRTSGSPAHSLAVLVRDVGVRPRYVVEVAAGVPVAYVTAIALILRLPVYWDRSPWPREAAYCPNR